MREVAALEAKNTLGSLLDLVQQGEEIVITRNGRPVARLIREGDPSDRRAAARSAVSAIAQLSQGVRLDGLSLKTLIEEGRP